MRTISNIDEIEQEINQGNTVYCGNRSYKVIRYKSTNELYIVCDFNGYSIGLYGKDRNKLNGDNFFVVD